MRSKRGNPFEHLRIWGVLILFACIGVGIGTATTVTVQPDSILPGGLFTVDVTGLPNNTPISLQVQGEFGVLPGGEFAFNLTNMTWPLKLTKSNATVTLEHTATNRIVLSEHDPEDEAADMSYIVEGASVGGVFSRDINGLETTMPEIEPDEEHSALFSGTAAGDATSVIATVTIKLESVGEPDFQIPVYVSGIDEGVVRVAVFVNGQVVTAKTLTVGNPAFADANIHATSIPVGASVYVDGVYAGQTPLYAKIPTGARVITIQKSGFYPYTRHLTIGSTPGLVIPVSAELILAPLGYTAPSNFPAPGSGGSGTAPGFLTPLSPYIPFPNAYTAPVNLPVSVPITYGYPAYPPGGTPGGWNEGYPIGLVNPNNIIPKNIPFPYL